MVDERLVDALELRRMWAEAQPEPCANDLREMVERSGRNAVPRLLVSGELVGVFSQGALAGQRVRVPILQRLMISDTLDHDLSRAPGFPCVELRSTGQPGQWEYLGVSRW